MSICENCGCPKATRKTIETTNTTFTTMVHCMNCGWLAGTKMTTKRRGVEQ